MLPLWRQLVEFNQTSPEHTGNARFIWRSPGGTPVLLKSFINPCRRSRPSEQPTGKASQRFRSRAWKARGAEALCTPALSVRKAQSASAAVIGILGARARTSQLASPPGGTWQCIPWRPSARTVETPLEQRPLVNRGSRSVPWAEWAGDNSQHHVMAGLQTRPSISQDAHAERKMWMAVTLGTSPSASKRGHDGFEAAEQATTLGNLVTAEAPACPNS
jgi:hypothetical protein